MKKGKTLKEVAGSNELKEKELVYKKTSPSELEDFKKRLRDKKKKETLKGIVILLVIVLIVLFAASILLLN